MAGLYKRGKNYYAMYFIGSKKHRVSLQTVVQGIFRFFGKTSKDVVNAYVEHIARIKLCVQQWSVCVSYYSLAGLD